MALSLSKRADSVVRSEIRNMSVECERVGGINLSQGVCDTEVPAIIRRGAQSAIDEGVNSYTRHDGLGELRRAIARKARVHSGIVADPETQIVVTPGSTGAFYCACMALLDPGDEVVLFEPYYGYHVNTLLAVDAVPTYVRMQPPDWTFTREALEAAITAKTRGIMICTPANPSGKVWTRAELELIADVAKKHDVFVFTDEVYEYFVFDGRKHISPATVPSLAERTISMFSLSKTFSITGWRIGFAISHVRWAPMIGYMNDLVYVCAPAPLQLGVARGLEALEDDYYTKLCREYQDKRDKVCAALQRAKLSPHVPQGAYYILADVSRIPGTTSKERAMNLLAATGVASVPGESFFHDDAGESMVRFCFAKTTKDLDEACRRLEAYSP